MVGYKKVEKELIEKAKDFYLEHGPGRVAERIDATKDNVLMLDFYHDVGSMNQEEHSYMWDIKAKVKQGPVETDEAISKKKAKIEEDKLRDMREQKKLRAAKEKKAAAEKLLATAETERIAAIAERDAKIKLLEEERERLLKESEDIV